MHVSAQLAILQNRVMVFAVIVAALALLPSTPCDAGMITYSIPVPAGPPNKLEPGGWGALVITLDKPAVFTTFIFQPQCPLPTDGIPDPSTGVPEATTWQLGPGGYKLGQTDAPVDPDQPNGPFFGPFLIGINFDGDVAPRITSAFWQNKPVTGGVRSWTFNPQKDLMADLSQLTTVPEPSTLCLVLPAAFLVGVFARRKKVVRS
jgi:hypothetical protein